MNLQGRFLHNDQNQISAHIQVTVTCRDVENDKIKPKKSSGLGASGESGVSPKNVNKDASCESRLVAILFNASMLPLTCCTKGLIAKARPRKCIFCSHTGERPTCMTIANRSFPCVERLVTLTVSSLTCNRPVVKACTEEITVCTETYYGMR